MQERKKKILSLLATTSILLTTTGCSNNLLKRKVNDNNEITYSGEISLYDTNDLYVIEILDLKGERKFYLTDRVPNVDGDNAFYLTGTADIYNDGIKILEIKNDGENYISDGEVQSVIPFNQFISTYAELKDEYTAQEIIDIYESVKKDYDELIKNENIKKLELK